MNNVIENNICDSPLPFLQYLSAPLQHNINILRGEKESEKDIYRVLVVTARTLWVTLVKGVVLAILHTDTQSKHKFFGPKVLQYLPKNHEVIVTKTNFKKSIILQLTLWFLTLATTASCCDPTVPLSSFSRLQNTRIDTASYLSCKFTFLPPVL